MSAHIYPTFPFYVEEELTDVRVLGAFEGGASSLAALDAKSRDTGERQLVVAFERPTRLSLTERTKTEQELHDIRRYLADAGRPEGTYRIAPGPIANKPPDAIVTIDGVQQRVEASQLVFPGPAGDGAGLNNLARTAQFELLKEHLIKQSGKLKARTRQHRGMLVCLWFGAAGSGPRERLAPRAKSIEELIDHLKCTAPPAVGTTGPGGAESGESIAYNADESIGCTWISLPPNDKATLFRVLGFDIALAYHQTTRMSDVLREITKIVADHDSDRNDVLVITVNAPTRGGWYFPTGGILADFLWRSIDELQIPPPSHLKSVFLHDQTQHRLHRLYPPMSSRD
ncbi:hypothetical protein [Gordonia hongkongensis]|uniref:hypothetical protein n=1 Tax=Gordonia hongkongensis TaxID=1701090 RepID=UPI003EB8969B